MPTFTNFGRSVAGPGETSYLGAAKNQGVPDGPVLVSLLYGFLCPIWEYSWGKDYLNMTCRPGPD